MKRNYFTAILLSAFAAIVVISCDKTDEIATGNPSVTSSGTISGQIDSLLSGTIDSIKVLGYHFVDNGPDLTLEFGKCKINGDKFLMQLITPPTHFLNHLQFEENRIDTSGYYIVTYSTNINVSDTTISAFGALEFNTHKNGISNGRITKTNNIMPFVTGKRSSLFLYSDKYCTIKGTDIEKGDYNNGSKKYMFKYFEWRYDMTLNPGWNEFVATNEKVIETDSTQYMIQSISNTIPADLKWKFIPRTNSYNSPQKRIGTNQKVHQLGFIGRLLK